MKIIKLLLVACACILPFIATAETRRMTIALAGASPAFSASELRGFDAYTVTTTGGDKFVLYVHKSKRKGFDKKINNISVNTIYNGYTSSSSIRYPEFVIRIEDGVPKLR
jgi:hypothetical protein